MPIESVQRVSDEAHQESSIKALMMAAAIQDHLLIAANDLERLQRLLDDSCSLLLEGFQGAAAQLGDVLDQGEVPTGVCDDFGELVPHHSTQHSLQETLQLQATLRTLYKAATALQFQDMATQLIGHTHQRLRGCVDQIARDAMGDDPDGEAVMGLQPVKPNPVTQDEMDAGSVELF